MIKDQEVIKNLFPTGVRVRHNRFEPAVVTGYRYGKFAGSDVNRWVLVVRKTPKSRNYLYFPENCVVEPTCDEHLNERLMEKLLKWV